MTLLVWISMTQAFCLFFAYDLYGWFVPREYVRQYIGVYLREVKKTDLLTIKTYRESNSWLIMTFMYISRVSVYDYIVCPFFCKDDDHIQATNHSSRSSKSKLRYQSRDTSRKCHFWRLSQGISEKISIHTSILGIFFHRNFASAMAHGKL